MTVPVATVQTKDHLCNILDASVNYLKTFVAMSDVVETRYVGSATTNASGKARTSNTSRKSGKASGARKKKSEDSKLDRYYQPAEWLALDAETRKKVMEVRKKRKVSKVTSSKASSDVKQDEDSDVSMTQRKSSKKTGTSNIPGE